MKKSSGFSSIEILAVLALFGLMMGLGVSNLKVIGNPAQNGAAKLSLFLHQARARAASSRVSYTVYPISKTEAAARFGSNCAALATTDDPKLRLVMPPGTEFTDVDWSTCFSSKGSPTENLEVFVRDSANPSSVLSVQVQIGGHIRTR